MGKLSQPEHLLLTSVEPRKEEERKGATARFRRGDPGTESWAPSFSDDNITVCY
jgi:hypothetical protein